MIPRRKKHYFETTPGMPAPISVEVRHRIVFSEVDALAIVWHGNYPKFFELAQTELGHICGLTSANYSRENIAAPIAQLHTDYFEPLYLDDIVTIRASLFWNDAARLDTEYEIRNSKNDICVTGYTVQLFVSLDKREPLWISPAIWDDCRRRWKDGLIHGSL